MKFYYEIKIYEGKKNKIINFIKLQLNTRNYDCHCTCKKKYVRTVICFAATSQ